MAEVPAPSAVKPSAAMFWLYELLLHFHPRWIVADSTLQNGNGRKYQYTVLDCNQHDKGYECGEAVSHDDDVKTMMNMVLDNIIFVEV